MNTLMLLLLGYLCGSVPFGKLIARHYGVDIQKRGSGNIGFANVRRIVGWRAGIFTLLADILKGFLPTVLALSTTSYNLAFWVGVSAVIGHVYPIWLRFHGGKGIATGLGLILALQPFGAVIGFMIYVAASIFFRRSFLASLLGTAVLAVIGVLIDTVHWWQYVLLLAIAAWTLRLNIAGTVPDYDT